MDIRTAFRNGTDPQKIETPDNKSVTVTPKEEGAFPEGELPIVETYDGNVTLSQYMDFLAKHDVHKQEILDLLAAIITGGNVQWGCRLFDKIDVRFRMRAAWVEERISQKLDSENSKNTNMSMMHFSNLIRTCNLAGSIAQYGDKSFSMNNDDDFMNAYKFVQGLPYPILVKLCDSLAVFDRAVAVAMSDWALKNFTLPQQAGA